MIELMIELMMVMFWVVVFCAFAYWMLDYVFRGRKDRGWHRMVNLPPFGKKCLVRDSQGRVSVGVFLSGPDRAFFVIRKRWDGTVPDGENVDASKFTHWRPVEGG